jgi:CRP/FNR family transcriptional regulator, cyclic AMP receptor protein
MCVSSIPSTRLATRIVHVLEVDPELGAKIPHDQLPLAAGRAVAPLLLFGERGPWEVDEDTIDGSGHLGLLIVEGMLARHVSVGTRRGIELLGPGDVLRPWVRSEFALADVNWTVIEPVRIASLDRGFAERVAPWPQIAGAIGDRLLMRARMLGVHLAVCHLVTVEERLLMIMWHFAERWGRVTPNGVVLRLALTHELLAGVVGARRPPVTTALSALAQKGLLRRDEEGTWILSGLPPESFTELHRQLGSPIESTMERP